MWLQRERSSRGGWQKKKTNSVGVCCTESHPFGHTNAHTNATACAKQQPTQAKTKVRHSARPACVLLLVRVVQRVPRSEAVANDTFVLATTFINQPSLIGSVPVLTRWGPRPAAAGLEKPRAVCRRASASPGAGRLPGIMPSVGSTTGERRRERRGKEC